MKHWKIAAAPLAALVVAGSIAAAGAIATAAPASTSAVAPEVAASSVPSTAAPVAEQPAPESAATSSAEGIDAFYFDPTERLGVAQRIADGTFAPTDAERDAARAVAGTYQLYVDTMRSCLAGKGLGYAGSDIDIAKRPFADDVRYGMPSGLDADQQHEWMVAAQGFDFYRTDLSDGSWNGACVTVADAAAGLGH